MIERVKQTEREPKAETDRVTVLDDRLLHLTREEAKAFLDAYLQERGLASEGHAANDDLPQARKRSERRPATPHAQS